MRLVHLCRFLDTFSVRVSDSDDIAKLKTKPEKFNSISKIKDITNNKVLSVEFMCLDSSITSNTKFKQLVWDVIKHKK